MQHTSFEFKPSSRIEPRVTPSGIPPFDTAEAMALSFYLNINVYEIEKISIKNTMYPEWTLESGILETVNIWGCENSHSYLKKQQGQST